MAALNFLERQLLFVSGSVPGIASLSGAEYQYRRKPRETHIQGNTLCFE